VNAQFRLSALISRSRRIKTLASGVERQRTSDVRFVVSGPLEPVHRGLPRQQRLPAEHLPPSLRLIDAKRNTELNCCSAISRPQSQVGLA
jgi:hypothetical protein